MTGVTFQIPEKSRKFRTFRREVALGVFGSLTSCDRKSVETRSGELRECPNLFQSLLLVEYVFWKPIPIGKRKYHADTRKNYIKFYAIFNYC